MRTIIIGGGASGLISACFASKKNNEVIILERNNACGKKILATGNGKCNYWNIDQNLCHYHSMNAESLTEIITANIHDEVNNFFNSIGIIPKIKNGYCYPYSNQATSIQTALILEAKLSGVKLENNVYVNDIIKNKNQFLIKTNHGDYWADKVVMATGSKAAPHTGSDGSGYQLIKNLGHSIIKPLPALVQLKGKENYFKEWAGIKQDVSVSLLENGEFIKMETGEIILTDYGVSGICVMQLSGMIARGLDLGKSEKIIINFVPWLGNNAQDFLTWMDARSQNVLNRTITELLDGILNYKLVNLLIKQSKIDKSAKWQDLNKNSRLILAKNIVTFALTIVDTNSFDKAQICSGGVPLNEINPKTMESRKSKGLYIIGELLDVDGDCGGYNLGFAWISGILAGKHISGEELK